MGRIMKLNPYEQIGVWHNDVLDYIISQNQNPTVDDALNLISTYFMQFLGTTLNPSPDSLKYLLKETSSWAINCNFDTIEIRRNRLAVTTDQLPFIDDIYDNNTGLSIGQLYQYYYDIENAILNSELEIFEQRSLLMATAVGKHSANYWKDVYDHPTTNPWHSYKTLSNYVGYVFADVTAALDGAFSLSVGRIDTQSFVAGYAAAASFVSL